MALTGLAHEVIPGEVDETPFAGEPPTEYVLRLAKTKARVVADQIGDQALVFAADTTVVEGGAILGKPADAAEATRMLERLRGHSHQVYTGLALVLGPERKLWTDLGATDVPMRDYTDEEIRAYVSSGDPLDKAGAYAIQHPGFHPVMDLHGCYANVVGLPLCHLARTLKVAGVLDRLDVPGTPVSAGAQEVLFTTTPQACQAFLGYDCPVYQRILRGDV